MNSEKLNHPLGSVVSTAKPSSIYTDRDLCSFPQDSVKKVLLTTFRGTRGKMCRFAYTCTPLRYTIMANRHIFPRVSTHERRNSDTILLLVLMVISIRLRLETTNRFTILTSHSVLCLYEYGNTLNKKTGSWNFSFKTPLELSSFASTLLIYGSDLKREIILEP